MPLKKGVGGAKFAEDFVITHHGQDPPLGRRARGFNIGLRL